MGTINWGNLMKIQTTSLRTALVAAAALCLGVSTAGAASGASQGVRGCQFDEVYHQTWGPGVVMWCNYDTTYFVTVSCINRETGGHIGNYKGNVVTRAHGASAAYCGTAQYVGSYW